MSDIRIRTDAVDEDVKGMFLDLKSGIDSDATHAEIIVMLHEYFENGSGDYELAEKAGKGPEFR